MNALSTDERDANDMSRLAGGHDAALNDLMERHAGRLFHYLARSLQDEGDAADLAQETFVKIYQNRAKFDPGRKFTTWLYAIASNLVRDRYRWRSRHQRVSLDAEHDRTGPGLKDTLTAAEPPPDQSLQTEERAEVVRKAVAALPEELRSAVILSEYEGLSQAEIGAVLRCSAKAVESRLYRARGHLRKRLESLLQPD
ncbi:MAG: RNA polymerase sigma factor [Limisphaerales bacterium]